MINVCLDRHGLPYYVGGVIEEQEELTLQTPESFWDRFRIDVRVRQEVTAINPAEKTVTVHALDSGKVYTETYDKLLLAPGAKPTVPALSGVDKRIDVLATAIRAKMTALSLTELDLSYAPPYSSAKDPVNMAGFMIEDLESGKVRQFHWNEVEGLPCDGSATLLDVRMEGEYRRGYLNGFRNIPLDDLREHLDELDRGKPVYVNCQTGLRSYLACRLLTQYGFSCSHLSGGYRFYQVVTQEQQTAQSAYPCGMEKL